MIVEYIDDHKARFGVEPICRELQVAPSTYYAAKARPPSARAVADAELTQVIAAEHAANYGVYGGAEDVEAPAPPRPAGRALPGRAADAGR